MKFTKSFLVAFRGIFIAIKSERNMKIHIAATLGVILSIIFIKPSFTDTIILLILIPLVLSAEMINTAIEKICNILRDKYKLSYEGSRDIRDIAGGAVLFQAIFAVIIGLLVISKYF